MSPLRIPVGPEDHVLGPPRAELTLVEYGDYECPHCRDAAPVLEEVIDRFAGRLRFAYRHFPLSAIHPHATVAAEIVESAAAQDRFWDMHRILFANQHALELDDLLRYAAFLRLDLSIVDDELEAHVHVPKIQRDFMGGIRSGANATPTLFINGRRHDGPVVTPLLVAALEQTLELRDQLH